LNLYISPVAALINTNTRTPAMTAPELLRRAADIIEQRGTEYDITGIKQERSMPRICEIFGESTGRQMTIGEGYLFLMALKTARIERSPDHIDSYLDRLAYQALKDEHDMGGDA
jgi:hypothetical protein